MSLRELSLFTGAGGGILGSKILGWRTIGYVEINDYCQRVIAQRIKDGIFDEAPIFSDINAFINQGYAERYRGMVDVVSGGFPCQPYSVAGRRLGNKDERNKWPETIKCIREVRPKLAFLENVAGIIQFDYFGQILADMAEAGFDVEWGTLSAGSIGYPHERERLWILGVNSNSNGVRRERVWEKTTVAWSQQQFERLVQMALRPELSIRTSSGISDGLANRAHRLKAIGNGQVPAVAASAFTILERRLRH